MLNVKRNQYRDFISLDGLWELKIDRQDHGETENWMYGFHGDHEIAVPGSWNEQLQEYGLHNYTGTMWLQKKIYVPASFKGRLLCLRIGSAEFVSTVWIDGNKVGENSDLFLPFDCYLSDSQASNREITVVVKISNLLTPDSITQQVQEEDYVKESRYRDELYPAVRFDFFPFGGIHRPVYLSALPHKHIKAIQYDTSLSNDTIHLTARITANASNDYNVRLSLHNENSVDKLAANFIVESIVDSKKSKNTIDFVATAQVNVNDFPLWDCATPILHALRVSLVDIGGDEIDQYELAVGLREVKVEGFQLLLNNKPVFLRGFGKHEDSPIHGKGLNLPQMVKDYALLDWINANSYRTSHYPYAEEWLDYADKKGVLVISEIPSINLDFRKVNSTTLQNHKKAISRQFERDYNHPSVIAWSLANEAGFLGEAEYKTQSGKYWESLFKHAKSLDPIRPMTMANVLYAGSDDPVFEYCDFLSINRYYGWYQEPGQLQRAFSNLEKELNYIGTSYNKPILVSEFGADTIAGKHSTSEQMFTEEYQSDLLSGYCSVIESSPYCIGEHIWNFADFKTAQHFRRVIFNLKGVFTRYREPKSAAFRIKDLWATPYQHKDIK